MLYSAFFSNFFLDVPHLPPPLAVGASPDGMASKAADVPDAPGPLIDLGMAPAHGANGNGAIYPKFAKRSWKEMFFFCFCWMISGRSGFRGDQALIK